LLHSLILPNVTTTIRDLLVTELGTIIYNTTTDKILMASFCGIHKDNISKYLVQLVKFGLINRVPVEYSNNLFTYHCFNDSIIEKLK